jgi:hypothetical protein
LIANRTQFEYGKEADDLTVTTAHSSVEDLSQDVATGLLLPDLSTKEPLTEARERMVPDHYEVPIVEVEHVERETESYVAWVIVLGFVAYAIALYWAHKCHRKGGDPIIKFSVLRGFLVKCIK